MMWERWPVNRVTAACLALLSLVPLAPSAQAEDGYDLWLRHAPLEGEAKDRIDRLDGAIYAESELGPTIQIAAAELHSGLEELRGRPPSAAIIVNSVRAPSSGPPGSFHFDCRNARMQAGGAFEIRWQHNAFRLTAAEPVGCLYASYALLRELARGHDPATISLTEAPAMPLRLLNHWDDPNGHVERGYAGRSIFDWWHLPERLDRRMVDSARANASIGINGVVVNNVNASPLFLTDRYLPKLKRLADAWRPYGIRLYISARFSAPRDIGGLGTADPLDPTVRAWWQAKADAIYGAIPDFGGFLVKANSEGQPGPREYGRTHVDGANMLAEALGERGTVIWRAFVYSAEDETDRAKQAYAEFVPLDGQFADNVVVQVKNGPIDFQPLEPFHPMFGAMPDTRLMLEAQVTKEYLGFASHLAFLAPMWREVLDADTGRGGTVARVVAQAGMAGVANTGADRNWTGSHFDQANWYAFGRLAWDPSLSSEAIAREWAALTFSRDPAFLDAVVPMMLASREAVVDYMTPLGLAHLMATGHHYGPGPWVCDLPRPEWNPCYYHRADAAGIGFDRTATGSDALSQYASSVARQWRDPASTDPRYLLWFHHLPWDYRLGDGQTLWEEMVHRYDRGVASVDTMIATWNAQRELVDEERFRAVSETLRIQRREARWWRDASLAYWQSLNGLPLPDGAAPVEHSLEAYRARVFPEAPGQ